jgi:Holliday junction resolvase RusA-like endonuclease
MIKAQRFRIRGIPYPHVKVTGNVEGRNKWTGAIVAKTAKLRKINGPCLVRVTFRPSREKFHESNPFGADLDNLLKRFCDALGRTVFSDAPGKDACVVAIEAAKALVLNPSESGVDGEMIEMQTAGNAVDRTRQGQSAQSKRWRPPRSSQGNTVLELRRLKDDLAPCSSPGSSSDPRSG